MKHLVCIDIGKYEEGTAYYVEVAGIEQALDKGHRILKDNKYGLFSEDDYIVQIRGTGAYSGFIYWDYMNGTLHKLPSLSGLAMSQAIARAIQEHTDKYPDSEVYQATVKVLKDISSGEYAVVISATHFSQSITYYV